MPKAGRKQVIDEAAAFAFAFAYARTMRAERDAMQLSLATGALSAECMKGFE